METLDLLYHSKFVANLVPETLDRDTPSIILAVFFFEHRKNCYSSKHPTTIEEVLSFLWRAYKFGRMKINTKNYSEHLLNI